MATNAITALNPAIWKNIVQDYLNKMLVSLQISNTKCEAYLSAGSSVKFPYLSDMYVQDYAQGTDLTAPAMTAVDDALTVDQSKAAVFIMDPVQERQALANYGVQAAYQSAYQLKNNIDQKVIATGVAGASSLNTVAGGTLSSANILTKLTDAYANLHTQNATDGEMFAIVDPKREALLTQTFIANGFSQADRTLQNQFAGRAVGFDIYVSNNLPSAVTLAMPTIPTAGGTFTMFGITFTWVAAASATTAGDISIGANVAASKANFLLMVAGTVAGSAATYVDLSAENRRKLQNAQLTASAWAATTADTVDLTYYGQMKATEAVTEADFVFGTETTTLLSGRKGAISLAIQMSPELYVREEPLQLAKNYITHCLYGTKIFTRDALRLAKITANM